MPANEPCTYVSITLSDGCKRSSSEHDFPQGAPYSGWLSRDWTHHAFTREEVTEQSFFEDWEYIAGPLEERAD